MRVVVDTSVLVAREAQRPVEPLPDEAETAISVITVAELRLGVLRAVTPVERSRRLSTLQAAMLDHEPLAIDADVAEVFADIVAELGEAGKNPRALDTLIAATARAHGAAVATQDDDFDDIPGLIVIKV